MTETMIFNWFLVHSVEFIQVSYLVKFNSYQRKKNNAISKYSKEISSSRSSYLFIYL